jgi:adenylylsulfate kinase
MKRAHGVVVWFTGKPSSGKSTLAARVHEALRLEGISACLLDGDEVRDALVPRPGYEPEQRDAFYASLAGLAALLARQGLVVLVAATAHARAHRERARNLAPDFLEVYVRVDEPELLRRDAKGLYAAVREGRLTGVPGGDLAYEEPRAPDVVAEGGQDAVAPGRVSDLITTRAGARRAT